MFKNPAFNCRDVGLFQLEEENCVVTSIVKMKCLLSYSKSAETIFILSKLSLGK